MKDWKIFQYILIWQWNLDATDSDENTEKPIKNRFVEYNRYSHLT